MSPPPAARIETEEQAGAWLEGLINVEKRPDWPYRRFSLEPIRALLDALGDHTHDTGETGEGHRDLGNG